MEDIWRNCLFPVMLGANTLCHACVRQMEKRLGVGSTVMTGKRALTLRFLPTVRLLYAPASAEDSILLTMLSDLSEESGNRVPLLVVCDNAYDDFVGRNRQTLEAHFILRRGEDILGRSMHV